MYTLFDENNTSCQSLYNTPPPSISILLLPVALLQLALIENRERGLAVVALEHVALASRVGKDVQVVVSEGVAHEDVVGSDGRLLELQAGKLDIGTSLDARVIDKDGGSGTLVLVLALDDVVGDLDPDGAVEDDAGSTVTGRVRRADIVMPDLCVLGSGINKDSDTALCDLVVLNISTVGLDAEADVVVGHLVLLDEDVGEVVHADGDGSKSRVGDLVTLNQGLDRASGESAILAAVGEGVASDAGVLASHDGDVEARELAHLEAADGDVLSLGLDTEDSAVLGDELLQLDTTTSDADTSLGLGAAQAGASVLLELLGRNNDCALLADELDTILADGDLLLVDTSSNDDLVTRMGLVDGGLDALVLLDVDGLAVGVVAGASVVDDGVLVRGAAGLVLVLTLPAGCRSS